MRTRSGLKSTLGAMAKVTGYEASDFIWVCWPPRRLASFRRYPGVWRGLRGKGCSERLMAAAGRNRAWPAGVSDLVLLCWERHGRRDILVRYV